MRCIACDKILTDKEDDYCLVCSTAIFNSLSDEEQELIINKALSKNDE